MVVWSTVCIDLSAVDSGNYTCEVRGPQSVVLGRITHYVYVQSTPPDVAIYRSGQYMLITARWSRQQLLCMFGERARATRWIQPTALTWKPRNLSNSPPLNSWTSHSVIAGLNPGLDKLLTHTRAFVTKQYNLVPVTGQCCRTAGKVTVGSAARRLKWFVHVRAYDLSIRGIRIVPLATDHSRYIVNK